SMYRSDDAGIVSGKNGAEIRRGLGTPSRRPLVVAGHPVVPQWLKKGGPAASMLLGPLAPDPLLVELASSRQAFPTTCGRSLRPSGDLPCGSAPEYFGIRTHRRP